MKAQQNIMLFILMSVVLHGLLVVWLLSAESVSLESPLAGSVLTIELVQYKKQPEVKLEKTAERKTVPEITDFVDTEETAELNIITVRKSVVAVKNRTQIKPEYRELKKQPVPEKIKTEKIKPLNEITEKIAELEKIEHKKVEQKKVELETVEEKRHVNYEQIALLIQNDLTKYFYYPVIAQRRHWQGQVIVEFTIFSSGLIDHVKIRESSGYTVLDDAALAAVKKIHQSEQFSLALNGQQISQLLPVTYKLIN